MTNIFKKLKQERAILGKSSENCTQELTWMIVLGCFIAFGAGGHPIAALIVLISSITVWFSQYI